MLDVKNVDLFYGDLQALTNISVKVDDGEIVTLLGSNGAGKSTIMKAIAGLVKPRQGQIIYDGKEINKLAPHRIVELGISLVPEGRRLFPEMTVRDTLEIGASSRNAAKYRRDNMEWIFSLFPVLKERANQAAGTMSGGEQQMLAIGRALMSQPRLLLIDEMSLGLSPKMAEEITHVIQEVNSVRKLTVFLVEQDVEIALSMASRGYVVENGHIVEAGETRLLKQNARVLEAYMGVTGSIGEKTN